MEEKVIRVEGKQNVQKSMIREDLNSIVSKFNFVSNKTRYGETVFLKITFFNDECLTISDKDGIYKLIKSYSRLNEGKVLKSVKLVEEYKTGDVGILDDDDNQSDTYISIVFEFNDGEKYRMFFSRRADLKIVDNFYKEFKKSQIRK